MTLSTQKEKRKKLTPASTQAHKEVIPADFLGDLRQLINAAKARVVRTINIEMTILYWHVGKRILEDILQHGRATYGSQTIKNLSRILKSEYGPGFSERNLNHMVYFAEIYPDLKIAQTLSAQLSWSHFIELLAIKDPLKRDFYAEMCRLGGWSVRTLHDKIHKMFYERTAIAGKPDLQIQASLQEVRAEGKLTPDMILKDPYVLNFLNVPDEHYESDLEAAILKELEKFMLEFGSGFSFIARQKHFSIDNDHYYLDLLFYNRRLKRLVAVELKKGKFHASYKGQMELYLRWLDRYERCEGENAPIGIILCTEKSPHQIELLDLKASSIHVAEYLLEIPPPDVFQRKIQEIVKTTKERLAIEGKVS